MKTSNIIYQIAQEISCQCTCYYNPKTQEIIGIPQENPIWSNSDFEEAFGDQLKIISENKNDFIKFNVLESNESFKIMESFVEQLTDNHYKFELEDILQKPKPFRKFKSMIEYSDYRQDWFNFKQKKLELRVKKQLDALKG